MRSTGKTGSHAFGSAFKGILLVALALAVWSNGLGQDSLNVSLLGYIETEGESAWIGATASYENYVYATGEHGLNIFDLTDPNSPKLIKKYHMQATASDIVIIGSTAYVSSGRPTLTILDLSQPLEPRVLGTCEGGAGGGRMVIDGSLCFMVNQRGLLCIVNIEDSGNPTEIGRIDLAISATDIAISDGFAIVTVTGGDAWERGALRFVNIQDPTSPQRAGSYSSYMFANGIAVSGDYCFVACGSNGLQIFRLGQPLQPSPAGSYPIVGAHDIELSGDFCYVTGDSGLYVIDISEPTEPSCQGFCAIEGWPGYVTITREYAYVSDMLGPLRIVDIEDPAQPRTVGIYSLIGELLDVEVAGDYCYLFDAGGFSMHGTFRIIEISDSSHPLELSQIVFELGDPRGMVLGFPYCYISDGNAGLIVVDVSNPHHPIVVGQTEEFFGFARAAISGTLAVVSQNCDGIAIIDISDPTEPEIISNMETIRGAVQAAISGEYCFLACKESGLRIVNLADPRNPEEVASWDIWQGAYSVAVHEGYCYVGAGGGDLMIWDVRDFDNPREIARDYRAGSVVDVAFSGHHAYVASSDRGLRVYDVANPDTAWQGGYYTPALGSTVAVEAQNGIAYVAETTRLAIYDCNAALGIEDPPDVYPSRFILDPVYPNPFNGVSNISFSLPGDDAVKIGVYNLRGELTESLFNGRMTAGNHSLQWNTTGAPTGVYWVKVTTNSGFDASERATLIK